MAQGLMCGVDLLASTGQCVWTVAEQVLRRCYSRGLEPCRRFLQTWCHLGDVYQVRFLPVRGQSTQRQQRDGRIHTSVLVVG